MDKGEVQQFDKPYILLQDKQGIFYDMVQQTGHIHAQKLIEIAEEKYKQDMTTRTVTPAGE